MDHQAPMYTIQNTTGLCIPNATDPAASWTTNFAVLGPPSPTYTCSASLHKENLKKSHFTHPAGFL